MSRSFFMIAAALALSGCTNLVPSTLMRLNALDPFTADPNDMAVALELPAGLALQPGSTEMMFKAVHSPSGETHQRDYTLQEQRTPDGLVIYTLSPEDIADLEAMKVSLLPWKDTSDGKSMLSMGVHSDACRVPGITIADDPRLSILLRLEQDGPLRPLLRDGPILEYFDVGELAELPQCGGPF